MSSINHDGGATVAPASSWNLPPGINSSHIVLRNNTLRTHFLSAGNPSNPLIILLHGFPELSYSWRHVLLPLSASPSSPGSSGYYVVAPDLRGFSLTSLLTRPDPSAPVTYGEDLNEYRPEEIVEDVVALVHALGKTKVHTLVGHDYGSPVAGNCTVMHPELFERLVLMSAPYTGPPPQTAEAVAQSAGFIEMVKGGLAALDPPRKHYAVYFSSPEANRDLLTGGVGGGGQGEGESYSLRNFMRAYWHVKSADWDLQKEPHFIPLPSPAEAKGGNPLEALTELPEYYIMRANLTMPQTVLPHLPHTSQTASEDEQHWMSDSALAVYVDTFRRTGFQGGLNLYRATTSPLPPLPNAKPELMQRKIEVPAMFIAGKMDWGTWQVPGAVEKMKGLCVKMKELGGWAEGEDGVVIVERAGHWVQQERPQEVVRLLAEFSAKGV